MTPDLASYDYIIVASSGGKDSTACILHLLEQGAPKDRIELWHHDIDGHGGSTLMDWPVTSDYFRAVAEGLDLKYYFSWRDGGFEREMLRENARTAPVFFETPEGDLQEAGGKRGKLGTRRKFPQVSANLAVRWCSSSLKIDVCSLAINNQERFLGKRTLVVTGERAEESAARAKYKTFEPHRCHRVGARVQRHVDHWRPVHGWPEAEVWAIIERWKIQPHPAYRLGWGRLSCAACIFGSSNQWASLKAVNPEQFTKVANYEAEFGCTIHRTRSVTEQAERGTAYEAIDPALVEEALNTEYTGDVFVEDWELPAGAFGENCGPS